jgi:hypothetical protein
MTQAWGHPAAAIDTDQLYFNVDARFELAYDDARNTMVLAQARWPPLFPLCWRVAPARRLASRPASPPTRSSMRASGTPARPDWTTRLYLQSRPWPSWPG